MTGARVLVVDDSRTVRLVVERTLARAGYRVQQAGDGHEALAIARAHPLDLVLVDVVMPRVGGLEFCRLLREDERHARLPIILMTARSDGDLDALVLESGAVDAIHKPFGPEALRAVTARALDAAERGATRPRSTAPPPSVGQPALPDRMPSGAATRLALELGPLVRRFTAGAAPTDAQLSVALEDGLSRQAAGDLARDLLAHTEQSTGPVGLLVDLESVSLPGVCQLLESERRTGILRIRNDRRRIDVCFRDGLIDFAAGEIGEREFLLGRYLTEGGTLSRELLEAEIARGDGEAWLGARLLDAELISAEALRAAIVRQTSELLYEALRWKRGSASFEPNGKRPEADDARLGLLLAEILLEGLRRIDEWRLIEERITSFDLVLSIRRDAVDALGAARLEHEEQTLLTLVDGARTVRDIVDASGLSSFAACGILFRLLTAGLVAQRPGEPAARGPSVAPPAT